MSFLLPRVASLSEMMTVCDKCHNLRLSFHCPQSFQDINSAYKYNLYLILPQNHCSSLLPGDCNISTKRAFQKSQVLCATQTVSISASATLDQDGTIGNQRASDHPTYIYHCTYLQITLWGSLARACANLFAISSDRYFTPAPNETRTKPFSLAPFTHVWRSC